MRWAGRTWSRWLRRKLDGTGVTWLMSWSATGSASISLKRDTNLTCHCSARTCACFVGPFRSLMRYLSSERHHKKKNMVPNRDPNEHLVEATADSMIGCGSGRACIKCDAFLAIVAVQASVKTARQNNTILDDSPTEGRPSIKRSSRERSERSRRNDTHMEKVPKRS